MNFWKFIKSQMNNEQQQNQTQGSEQESQGQSSEQQNQEQSSEQQTQGQSSEQQSQEQSSEQQSQGQISKQQSQGHSSEQQTQEQSSEQQSQGQSSEQQTQGQSSEQQTQGQRESNNESIENINMPQMNFGFDLNNGTNNQNCQSTSSSMDNKAKENSTNHTSTQNNNDTKNQNSPNHKDINNQSKNHQENQYQIDSQSKSSNDSNEEQSQEDNNNNHNQMNLQNINNTNHDDILPNKQNKNNHGDSETTPSNSKTDSKSKKDLTKPDNNSESQNQEKVSNETNSDNKNDLGQNNENLNNSEKLNKLTDLRDKLLQYKQKKEADEAKAKLEKSKLNAELQETEKSEEQKYELSEQTNNFINELKELPSFEDRNRGASYAIDTESYTEVPDTVIKTLITKFLNQRFCKKNTDLNIRSNSLEKSNGFYKWEVKDVITHLETHQVTKVLTDKYGYQYAEGKNENVPLSFYFDLSGSMSEFTNMLAIIAIELLKKKVKVLIGFNERVNVQIESIDGNIDIATLAKVLSSAGYSSWGKDGFIKDSRVTFKYIDKNIDNYLIEKKAEKCVIFSDFDPKDEVINLSGKAEVYWFCFENSFTKSNLGNYNGFVYKVKTIGDIAAGLVKVSQNKFNTLCYTDNPEGLRKIRSKKK